MEFLGIDELKALSLEDATRYCSALRSYIIQNVSKSGGHLASNLGVTEISLAVIRAFDSPRDKIIYDVGHQSYVHKLLTGRIFTSETLRTFGGYSGFTKIDESTHDPFGAGHSSTALSAAIGFARAARLRGEDSYAVAIIGDGAFCNGMTFEALNNLSKDDKIIIILNDNEMSISKNVGSVAEYLNKIRVTKKYLKFKRKTKNTFIKVKPIYKLLTMLKRIAKRLLIPPTMFDDLGIEYIGAADGNDFETVEFLLNEAKLHSGPVLLHFVTKKGCGLPEAEANPDKFHFVSPTTNTERTFSTEYSSLLLDYAGERESVVAITAAMGSGTGLTEFKKEYPHRFFDVGICEEHAATFCGALSAAGLEPYFSVYSTFFQRAYDQMIHDIALQKLSCVIALDRAGLVGADGATHHGVFDVSMTLNVPDVTIYSPATFAELKWSFDTTKNEKGLRIIRYPKDTDNELLMKVFRADADFSIDTFDPCDVLIVTYGRIAEEALRAKLRLKQKGIGASVLKFLKLTPLDYKKINSFINKLNPRLIVVVEEGMKTGGFGEHFLANITYSIPRDIIAIDNMFVPHGKNAELYEYCGLSSEKIYQRILKCL